MSQEQIHRYVTLSQIDDLRDAAYETEMNTAGRDEVLIVILSDLGLRASEAVQLRRSMFHLKEGYVQLPASIQKDYPTDSSPSSARMELDPQGHFNTVRLLRRYFSSEWWQDQDGNHVFPSRQSKQMSTRSVRNRIKSLAERADVAPRRTDGQPAEPSEMHPHALRHSLASWMLQDDSVRLIDVRNRLRHRSIRTTEKIYEHFQSR